MLIFSINICYYCIGQYLISCKGNHSLIYNSKECCYMIFIGFTWLVSSSEICGQIFNNFLSFYYFSDIGDLPKIKQANVSDMTLVEFGHSYLAY